MATDAGAAGSGPRPRYEIPFGNGEQVIYFLPFDKQGDLLMGAHPGVYRIADWIKEGGFTSVKIMSHGWNNTPSHARELYHDWFELLDPSRDPNSDSKPLRLGVSWPSILASIEDGETWEDYLKKGDVGTSGSALSSADLYSFHEASHATPSEAWIQVVASLLASPKDAKVAAAALSANDYETALQLFASSGAFSPEVQGGELSADQESTTVYIRELLKQSKQHVNMFISFHAMRKRAADVAQGKGFQSILASTIGSNVPVDLLGHSLGSRICLHALETARRHKVLHAGRQARSLVLMQPAVSRWCMSIEIPHTPTKPGLYRQVPDVVRKPVIVFYSVSDFVLTVLYPLSWSAPETDLTAFKSTAEDHRPLTDSEYANDLYAALGAHGPDMNDKRPPGFLHRVPIDTAAQELGRPLLRVLGVKGDWAHGHHGDKVSRGWCIEIVTQLVALLERD